MSKKLRDTERKWAIWEKEAFAIWWAFLTWRQFLEGGKVPFEVWTDHKNLEALKTPRKLSPKQIWWVQHFRQFRFELKYIPVGKNVLADALSRRPQFESCREEVIHAIIPFSQPEVQVMTRCQARWQPDPRWDKMTTALKTMLPSDQWFTNNKDFLTMRMA